MNESEQKPSGSAGDSLKTASSSASSSSSDVGSFNEESFIELLKSQVNRETIEEILAVQRKTLDRFEKTNEMLATCRSLSEKRMEDARKQFNAGKETVNQAKSDLESVFKKLNTIKAALSARYPEIYERQTEQVGREMPPDEEED
ncbi:KxDL motif-containing protein [Aphelenchoides fujianensis]|nr:KxDL motif-containing protein [Aphelenchoides fujianensis]